MRIGVDARMWGKGYGIGRYIEQLLFHLLQEDASNTYFLFVLAEQKEAIEQSIIERVGSLDSVRLVVADVHWYTWKEQLFLPRILKKVPVDIMHFPHWNIPFLYRKPFVATVHDLTMFHYPRPDATTRGKLVYFLKDTVHRWLIRDVVKRAKKLFVTTEFTKQDVHNTFGVPIDKMVVTYQAPYQNQEFNKTKKQENNQTSSVPLWQELFERFDITGWYAMYVGSAYPHKNLLGLLRAWKRFEDRYGSQYQLVLVGKKNTFYDRILESEEMKSCKNVVYTGFLNDEELDEMYQKASLFVFPSLYEGFGMPPLEAMTRGVPVVSSHASCLPEVLGEGALYVDPENSEQLVDAMYTGFTDDDVRSELIEKGKKELVRYSWKELAKQTLVVYESMR